MSSAVGLKICAITVAIKKYKSKIKEKKRGLDKILLAKAKLSTLEALTFKVLIDSVISDDE